MFSKLSGFNDWNTAKAKGLVLGPKLAEDTTSQLEIVEKMYEEKKAIDAGLKDFVVVSLTLQASATVVFSHEYRLRDKTKTPETVSETDLSALKQRFLSDIREGRIAEAQVVEPPVEEHDFGGEADVEVEEITTHGAIQERVREQMSFMPFMDRYQKLVELKEIEEIEKTN
jgi:hypothetical protein